MWDGFTEAIPYRCERTCGKRDLNGKVLFAFVFSRTRNRRRVIVLRASRRSSHKTAVSSSKRPSAKRSRFTSGVEQTAGVCRIRSAVIGRRRRMHHAVPAEPLAKRVLAIRGRTDDGVMIRVTRTACQRGADSPAGLRKQGTRLTAGSDLLDDAGRRPS